MDSKNDSISSDLQTQWQDHFHMRDQTWKVLYYSILFFLGVVVLEAKGGVASFVLLLSYFAVIVMNTIGFLITSHHLQRQVEKFKIIIIYEKELGLFELIEPVLKEAKKGISTPYFIMVIQAAQVLVSVAMIVYHLVAKSACSVTEAVNSVVK